MRVTFLFLILAVSGALLATGCSSSTCNATNCSGCCDSNGLCNVGNTNNASGSHAEACLSCSGEQVCELGLCQTPVQNTCSNCAAGSCCSGTQCVTECPGGMACISGACQFVPTDGGGPTDGGHPSDGGTCGPGNCSGCCIGTVCVPPSSQTSVCGLGGEACQTCSGTASCQAGVCVSGCGPGNCSGCCVGSSCVAGTSTSDCGANGRACTACTGGESCSAGQCIGGSCSGCISTTGACLAGTSNAACGAGGAACVACSAGETCNVLGQCQATSCTGCIDSTGACQPGTSTLACGIEGAACAVCPSGDSCSSGACVAPSNGCTHYTNFPVAQTLGDVQPDSGFVGYTISEAWQWNSSHTSVLLNQMYEQTGVAPPVPQSFVPSTGYGACIDCITIWTGCSASGCQKMFLAQTGSASVTQADQTTPGSYISTGSSLQFLEWDFVMNVTDQAVVDGGCIQVDSMSVDATW